MQNNGKETYITILKQSLTKKIEVLDAISAQNQIQADLAKAPEFDYDVFGQTLEEKEKLINQMQSLDAGFQSVYQRIKGFFEQHKAEYKTEIQELKALIGTITDKSVQIMAEEKRNQQAILNRKDSLKKEVQMKRATNKAAANYYKSMSKLTVLDSQFIDKKK